MGKRSDRNRGTMSEFDDLHMSGPSKAATKEFSPKTKAQKQYLSNIRSHTVTFGIGPAGTGKTYVAVCEAARLLASKEISKFIVTRPIVEAEEQIGFLPGDQGEKTDPYFKPVIDILTERLGRGHVEAMQRQDKIVFEPLAFMRGKTFKDAFVLLDEAQNTTPSQMKLFLSRIGENATYVIDGDIAQTDIKGPSGLADARDRLERFSWCATTRFGIEDIVRSGPARDIILAYQGEDPSQMAFPDFLTKPIET